MNAVSTRAADASGPRDVEADHACVQLSQGLRIAKACSKTKCQLIS